MLIYSKPCSVQAFVFVKCLLFLSFSPLFWSFSDTLRYILMKSRDSGERISDLPRSYHVIILFLLLCMCGHKYEMHSVYLKPGTAVRGNLSKHCPFDIAELLPYLFHWFELIQMGRLGSSLCTWCWLPLLNICRS